MTRRGVKRRVIVYIDGYNLDYGQRGAFGSKYRWLDLQVLSESFLRPGMDLVSVKYFTAITKSDIGSRHRQSIYLKALRAHCHRLEIFYGRFLSKHRRCSICGAVYATFEEKKTDVNIACQILNDAHFDRYDCCYVVSGDSDLVPPIKIVKEHHPGKQVMIAHPPRRKSSELCKSADGWFFVNEQKLKRGQLPERVASARDGEMIRPAEWR